MELPAVSYVMPVLNEVEYLEEAVRGVLGQEYPSGQELVIALGASTDGTNEVAARLAAADPRVILVDNPDNDVPVGLNLATRASHHPIIVRVDAHSTLPDGYTATMVETLLRTGSANVGGVMKAQGRTPFQRAVARVYNSPWGLGGNAFHGSQQEGPAETAYLGVCRRDVLDEVGGYDETMRRAQDWELNSRIIAAGHQVWFTPDVEVGYWPRSTPGALRRQMFATGVWRGHLVRRQGHTPLRYLAPPALVVGLGASAGAALVQGIRAVGGRKTDAAWAAHLVPLAYAGGLAAVGARLGGETAQDRVLNVVALGIVHVSWGAGFLKGWVAGAESTVDRSRSN